MPANAPYGGRVPLCSCAAGHPAPAAKHRPTQGYKVISQVKATPFWGQYKKVTGISSTEWGWRESWGSPAQKKILAFPCTYMSLYKEIMIKWSWFMKLSLSLHRQALVLLSRSWLMFNSSVSGRILNVNHKNDWWSTLLANSSFLWSGGNAWRHVNRRISPTLLFMVMVDRKKPMCREISTKKILFVTLTLFNLYCCTTTLISSLPNV